MTTPFSTPDSAKAFHLDVKGVAPKDVIADALVLQTSTKAGNVEGDEPAVRVPFVSLEDQPDFVPEGDPIAEADPDDTEVVIHTGKVAVLVPISREQYGTEDTASLLSDAVRDALIRKANRAYLAQAAPSSPAVTPPAGLIHQSLGTVTGTVQGNDLDPIVDAVALVETAGGTASHILASPQSWAYIQKLKDGNDVHLLGAGTQAGPRTLLGLPVLVDRDVPDWQLIVLDRRAILSVYGSVLVARSDDFYFNQDSIAVRATFRFGAKVSDTDRVVLVPVLDAT